MTSASKAEPPLFITDAVENEALLDEMRPAKKINGSVLRGFYYSWSSGQPTKGYAQGWYRGEKVKEEV